MSTVYLVSDFDGYYCTPEAVFSTLEKAKEYRNRRIHHYVDTSGSCQRAMPIIKEYTLDGGRVARPFDSIG